MGSLGAKGWAGMVGEKVAANGGMIAFGAISGGIGAELFGGNFFKGFVIGGTVAGLNDALHIIAPAQKKEITINGKTYSYDGLKEYYAVVIGESSNNIQEAQGIGEVILNRIDDQGTKLTDGFISKIGGAGQYDAIGGKIYNDIMDMKLFDIIDMKPNNIYYNRSIGASKALSNWWNLKPGITNGAYFWNATWQKDRKNVGANWRAYNKGIFVISAQLGQTTFFKYSNSNKKWP